MNKIIQINLAGQAISIDENAYDNLAKYLRTLENHFKNTESGDEILADIEGRLAEVFLSRLKSGKAFVDQELVDESIELMGTPIEMEIDEEQTEERQNQNQYQSETKKLYRNPDDKILGGVCSGIANYFNVEPGLVRLITFLIIVFTAVPFLIYIIFWIVVPSAKTPEDKARMFGGNFNINDIARNVREEANSVADNLKKNDTLNRTYSTVNKGANKAGKQIAKLFGFGVMAFLLVVGVVFTVGFLAYSTGNTNVMVDGQQMTLPNLFDSQSLTWVFTSTVLAVVLIPIITICYSLILYIFDSTAKVNFTIIGLAWLVSLLILIGVLVYGGTQLHVDGVQDFIDTFRNEHFQSL